MPTHKKHRKQNHHKAPNNPTGKQTHPAHHSSRKHRIAKWSAILLAGIMIVSAFAGFFVVKW